MDQPASYETWTSPSGTLARGRDGGLTAVVRANLRTRDAVEAAVRTVAGLERRPFLRCSVAQKGEDGYRLVWSSPLGKRLALSELAGAWRREPKHHVADAIHVAMCVSRAASELEDFARLRILLSPEQIFLEQMGDDREAWSVLALPIPGVEYRDVAATAPHLASWLSGDDLVWRGSPDRTYMLGAILYYCLIDDLHPTGLSNARRLQRIVAYRAGNAARLRETLGASIPASLRAAATGLGDFILTALGPNIGRPLTPRQAVTVLGGLETELATPRLAAAWETAGDRKTALAILQSYARWAPRDEIPWQTIARLRDDRLSLSDVRETLIARIRAAGALGAAGQDQVAREVVRLRDPAAKGLAEDEYLFLAYANARWLGNVEETTQLLARKFSISWNVVLQALLLARLHAESASWPQVGRDCRDCCTAIDQMPNRGSGRGAYALSYVLLLDAIAHMGIVEAGHAPDYLRDAWKKLARAWSSAQPLEDAPLNAAIAARIAVLGAQAGRIAPLDDLAREIAAFCNSAALPSTGSGADGAYAVPWFDDRWLFGS